MKRLALTLTALCAFAAGLAHAATCSVTEFSAQAPTVYQAALVPALVQQTAITVGSTTQSSAFNSATRLVRIDCTASAYITFGTNPTATATGIALPANVPEYFSIAAPATPGATTLKVAVLTGPT